MQTCWDLVPWVTWSASCGVPVMCVSFSVGLVRNNVFRRHPVAVWKLSARVLSHYIPHFLQGLATWRKKKHSPTAPVNAGTFCATKWDQNESYTSSILNYWSSDSRGVMMPYLRVQHWWWVPTLGRLLHEGCPGLWAKDGKRQNNAKHN